MRPELNQKRFGIYLPHRIFKFDIFNLLSSEQNMDCKSHEQTGAIHTQSEIQSEKDLSNGRPKHIGPCLTTRSIS